MKRKKRVLITGAGGFLGTAIVKRLSLMPEHESYELVHFSRRHYPHLSVYPIEQRQGDITDDQQVAMALVGVDTVIHTASLTDMWGPWEKFYQTNFLGTTKLLQAAQLAGVKNFIYTSSPSVVFGKDSLSGVDETTPYPHRYYSFYARSKAMAEAAVLAANHRDFCTVSLRPHLLWGALDPHFLPRLKERSEQKRLFQVGNGTNLVDVIYVDNAAYAHELALKKLAPGSALAGHAYFLGQERPVYFWSFLNQLLQVAKLPPLPARKVAPSFAYLMGAMMEFVFRAFKIYHRWPLMTRFMVLQMTKDHYFSHHQAKVDLGYHPLYSIEEGLIAMEKELQAKSINS